MPIDSLNHQAPCAREMESDSDRVALAEEAYLQAEREMESDSDRAALAEEAYFQAEREIEKLSAKLAVLERRLAEEQAKNGQILRDFKLLLGEAGVDRVHQMLVDSPDRDIEAALVRYSHIIWG